MADASSSGRATVRCVSMGKADVEKMLDTEIFPTVRDVVAKRRGADGLPVAIRAYGPGVGKTKGVPVLMAALVHCLSCSPESVFHQSVEAAFNSIAAALEQDKYAFFPYRDSAIEYQLKTTHEASDDIRRVVRTLFPKMATGRVTGLRLSNGGEYPQEMAPIGLWHALTTRGPKQLPQAMCEISDPKHAICITVLIATLSAAFLFRLQAHPNAFEALPALDLEEALGMCQFYSDHAEEIAAAAAEVQAAAAPPPQPQQPLGADQDIPQPEDDHFESDLQQVDVQQSAPPGAVGGDLGMPAGHAYEGEHVPPAADDAGRAADAGGHMHASSIGPSGAHGQVPGSMHVPLSTSGAVGYTQENVALAASATVAAAARTSRVPTRLLGSYPGAGPTPPMSSPPEGAWDERPAPVRPHGRPPLGGPHSHSMPAMPSARNLQGLHLVRHSSEPAARKRPLLELGRDEPGGGFAIGAEGEGPKAKAPRPGVVELQFTDEEAACLQALVQAEIQRQRQQQPQPQPQPGHESASGSSSHRRGEMHPDEDLHHATLLELNAKLSPPSQNHASMQSQVPYPTPESSAAFPPPASEAHMHVHGPTLPMPASTSGGTQLAPQHAAVHSAPPSRWTLQWVPSASSPDAPSVGHSQLLCALHDPQHAHRASAFQGGGTTDQHHGSYSIASAPPPPPPPPPAPSQFPPHTQHTQNVVIGGGPPQRLPHAAFIDLPPLPPPAGVPPAQTLPPDMPAGPQGSPPRPLSPLPALGILPHTSSWSELWSDFDQEELQVDELLQQLLDLPDVTADLGEGGAATGADPGGAREPDHP